MRFLCIFYHRLLGFRRPEVESLSELFEACRRERGQEGDRCGHTLRQLEWSLPEGHHVDSPFHYVSLPSEEIARSIANRSLLVRGMYEVWGEGESLEELEEAIKGFPDDRKLPYLGPGSTFRITVDGFGKVISFQEQNERMHRLSFIPFKGQVDLKNPNHKFLLMETDDYGNNNGLPPVVRKRIFFCREVGAADRKLLPAYQLKSRKYLGPTAMDAEMAFLMANQGLAARGKLVYDPFVGTGSVLVGAAHFGAMTMGADIDIRVVRDGRGPDCNVWSNFEQYRLPAPISLLRADNNLPPWRSDLREIFDAIICDPPYGVRAGGRKSGGRKLLKGAVSPYIVPEEKRTDHIPSTAPYCLAECMHDLLDLSAKMLTMGGRLVFFYPVSSEEGLTDTNLPQHPCFTLIASSEQILSLRYSRCLLTMVKTSTYTDELAETARLMHLNFKENHMKWLEDGSLHTAVFSPANPQASSSERDPKPRACCPFVVISQCMSDVPSVFFLKEDAGVFQVNCSVGKKEVPYIGSGGVFPTNTTAGNLTIGLDGLKTVCLSYKLPVVAIGGIKFENAHTVMDIEVPNLRGVAAVSALFDHERVLSERKRFTAMLTESASLK